MHAITLRFFFAALVGGAVSQAALDLRTLALSGGGTGGQLAAAGKNFTQYLCNGTDALSWCMNGEYAHCQVSTHAQGACLRSAAGHSLTAVCDAAGAQVRFLQYESSANCTGGATAATQLADVCQQGGGGQYFVKLECQS